MENRKYGVSASDSPKYIEGIHFIVSDITADFLLKHGIPMSIARFKKQVQSSRHAFREECGNVREGRTSLVKVYDINAIKKNLSALQMSLEDLA